MPIDSTIFISAGYFLSSLSLIYSQHLCGEFAEPVVDLKYAGITIFLVGVVGNFYHHYLLSELRKEGEKQYKIPRGGLFDLVNYMPTLFIRDYRICRNLLYFANCICIIFHGWFSCLLDGEKLGNKKMVPLKLWRLPKRCQGTHPVCFLDIEIVITKFMYFWVDDEYGLLKWL